VLRRGDEYQNIFPVWDWHRIPGVTAKASGSLPENRQQRNRSEFVGGVSGDKLGVTAMRFDKGAVKARKTWFFTHDGVVCLGAGIQSEAKTPIHTTLAQRLLEGEVKVKPAGKSEATIQSSSKKTYDAPAWVHHDGVGYVLLRDGKVSIARRTQQGSWASINASGPSETVEKRVFSAWLDHGSKPSDAKYAYRVLPDATADETAQRASASDPRVLANTQSVQAVRNASRNLVQAVFYQADRLKYAEGRTLRLDKPCIVMVQRNENQTTLTVADPTQQLDNVTVAIDGQSRDLSLPDGLEAGRSKAVTWEN